MQVKDKSVVRTSKAWTLYKSWKDAFFTLKGMLIRVKACVRNLDLRVQSVTAIEHWASKSTGGNSTKSLKIRGCKRRCPKDLRVCAPAAPVLTHSLNIVVQLSQLNALIKKVNLKKKPISPFQGLEVTEEKFGFSSSFLLFFYWPIIIEKRLKIYLSLAPWNGWIIKWEYWFWITV